MKCPVRHRGVAAILALIVLAMFAILGVAHMWTANSSLVKTENVNRVHRARQQAESGLEYFRLLLTKAELPGGVTGEALATALVEALPAPLNTEISADDSDGGFTATLSADGSVVTLSVCGRHGEVHRTVTMDFIPGSSIFDYAVAGMGEIEMKNNSRVRGANSVSEANVLSATYQPNKGFKLSNNAAIEGDVYAPNPDADVNVSRDASIGGEYGRSAELEDHIHRGINDVEFPEVDSSVFEPFVGITVVDADTPTEGVPFANIRIAEGANPDFEDSTIEGVVFIETPNEVTFSGNTTIAGVIITQDAGDGAYSKNKIEFKDNATIRGVEDLGDEYSGLKQLPGSSVLAPGFEVKFKDNFGTIRGALAADKFTFDKDTSGTMHGPIICYSSEKITLSGNSVLTFDRSASPDAPPGFALTLVAVPGTYLEH